MAPNTQANGSMPGGGAQRGLAGAGGFHEDLPQGRPCGDRTSSGSVEYCVMFLNFAPKCFALTTGGF
jgi:hypothetical protein